MSRILIVDDERSIRLTLCEFLRLEGHQADNAEDVPAATRMLEEYNYDVVVSDIIMPRVSGIELLGIVRAKSKDIQYIVMTGEPSVDTAITAVQQGANDYLVKPITREAFLKAVRSAALVKELTDQKTALEQANQAYQRNLEHIVELRTNELQNAMQGIVSLLTSVVEARDPYTAGHQRRVGNLSAAIATKMGLDNKTTRMLRIIGYIHDIGKISIPTEILSKPGKLNELERALIQNHPAASYEMMMRVDLPDVIGKTLYQHHERCDGTGYPQGLTKESITLEAQIIMVADVVEAMMSHRPYRPALGIEAALEEIRAGRTTKFNPDVVAACESLFHDDQYQIEDCEYKIHFPLLKHKPPCL